MEPGEVDTESVEGAGGEDGLGWVPPEVLESMIQDTEQARLKKGTRDRYDRQIAEFKVCVCVCVCVCGGGYERGMCIQWPHDL